MTFTEAVLEWSDPRQPLCRHTEVHPGAYAIYRVSDDGRASRRHRAHVTYRGPAAHDGDLARELQEAHASGDVEILHRGNDHVTLHFSAPVADEHGPRGLVGAPVLLRERGFDAVMDPVIIRGGRAQTRLVMPRPIDTPDLMRGLQDVQRACGFQDFRVLRTQAIDPHDHLGIVRRILSAEQEDLMRLAAEMGYYDTPKRVTLEEIARRVGLSISPIHKRLKSAEEALVAARIGGNGDRGAAARRRARREHRRIDGERQWEVHLRARGPLFGPGEITASAPNACVVSHVLSEDRATGAATLLLAIRASVDFHEKILSSLADRSEIMRTTTLHRGADVLTVRLETRGRTGYGVGWWTDAWRNDALLRPLLYDRDELNLRMIIMRPLDEAAFHARVEEMARSAGWSGHEIVSLRPHAAMPPPATAGDSLTPRQMEVLRVAEALGYYRTPRGCTLESVANTLGVSANAIHKNLVLAESKIIASYLAAGL